MPELLCYRGRRIEAADIEFIKELIAQNPTASRHKLSIKLCLAWQWVQANGHLRDMVCRSLMLQLHRAHLIELPPRRGNAVNNVVLRRAPVADSQLEGPLLECSLEDLGDLEIRQVRRTQSEALFGCLVQTYHYLCGRRNDSIGKPPIRNYIFLLLRLLQHSTKNFSSFFSVSFLPVDLCDLIRRFSLLPAKWNHLKSAACEMNFPRPYFLRFRKKILSYLLPSVFFLGLKNEKTKCLSDV
jgi:hypothetical protein